jgi:hypothetical protein
MGHAPIRQAALIALVAALVPAGVALAGESVFDRTGDAESGALDLVAAGFDDSCQMTFTMTVQPTGTLLRKVAASSGDGMPAIQLDRNADGRVDRLIGRPKGRPAGVYAVSGKRIGNKVAAAKLAADPFTGAVRWTLRYSLAVSDRKLRWRAVNRSVAAGAVDSAPDKGFRLSRWARRGC